MKSMRIVIVALLVLVSNTGVAQSALRAPQVPVQGPGLQAILNLLNGGIDVHTAQLDAQRWGTAISNNSTFTMQLELTRSSPGSEIGIYNGGSAAPVQYRLFPASATDGWFLIASFRTAPVRVLVNLFDAAVNLVSSTTFLGADRFDFGFYLQNPGGTFYSQDIRNADHDPRVLSFAGTGFDAGNYWMAFEDGPEVSADHDFDDVVLFVEGPAPFGTAPVDVVLTSWGQLKDRFR